MSASKSKNVNQSNILDTWKEMSYADRQYFSSLLNDDLEVVDLTFPGNWFPNLAPEYFTEYCPKLVAYFGMSRFPSSLDLVWYEWSTREK